MNDRSEPTWENQLWHARRVLADKGPEALNNPHAMIGRTCGCGTCFCCAALRIYKNYQRGLTVKELTARVQWLINNWPVSLEDNGITFPDGAFWPQSTAVRSIIAKATD